ncbi:hypothetical protein CTAM01_01452, partial [Colletotrichum tamarilloi]
PRLPRIKDGTTGPRRDEILQLSWIDILRDFAVQERGWTYWKPRWFCGRAARSGPVWTKVGVRPSAGCACKNIFLHVASGTAAKRSPRKERNPFCPPFQGQALWLRENVEPDNGLKDSQKAQPPLPLPRPHPSAGWAYEEGEKPISNPSAINFSPQCCSSLSGIMSLPEPLTARLQPMAVTIAPAVSKAAAGVRALATPLWG